MQSFIPNIYLHSDRSQLISSNHVSSRKCLKVSVTVHRASETGFQSYQWCCMWSRDNQQRRLARKSSVTSVHSVSRSLSWLYWS